ncbi:hypothetical protein P8V84_28325, partial [Klebsiella pneumoniae]|uniref:hypothetical protein n=1 Tax=Klebsiella pneumoniae TaxID=573 RepID=UPI002412BE0C
KNKTLVISETKENKFKSISEGVEYVHLFPKNLKILIKYKRIIGFNGNNGVNAFTRKFIN